ncbi:hypothetical protein [Oceaniglobus indicus]|uniref:hypothetical protein n=1 Tax=Oceaniglobus indicus TaxID=2047749 RepID=UPI000C1A852E|nr:hypothetical protein [Oceaniglobus indicus]
MIRIAVASMLGLGGLFLATQNAFAETPNRNCAARATVVERLNGQFGETRQSIGLASNAQVVEVFASVATGTWTILVSTPAGVSCVVAAGQAFENLAESLPPAGQPA